MSRYFIVGSPALSKKGPRGFEPSWPKLIQWHSGDVNTKSKYPIVIGALILWALGAPLMWRDLGRRTPRDGNSWPQMAVVLASTNLDRPQLRIGFFVEGKNIIEKGRPPKTGTPGHFGGPAMGRGVLTIP